MPTDRPAATGRPPPSLPLVAVLAALLPATAPLAQDTCASTWTDGHYLPAASAGGVDLRVNRFCFGKDLDNRVEVCGLVENRTLHRVEVRWRFVARCPGGVVEDAQERSVELAPGEKWGGGGYLMSPECFAPCPPFQVPSQAGWRVDVTDLDEEERRRAAKEQEEQARREREEKAQVERERQAQAERDRQEQERRREAERKKREEAKGLVATAQAGEAAAAAEAEPAGVPIERDRVAEARQRYEERKEQEAQAHASAQASMAAMGAAMANAPDRKARPNAWISRLTVQAGPSGIFVPLVYDATGTDLSAPYSAPTTGGGYGLFAGVEAWPFLGPKAGVALMATYHLAMFSGGGSSEHGSQLFLGGKAHLGDLSAIWLIGEAGRLQSTASSSGQIGWLDVWQAGSGKASATRLGVGVGACTSETDGACHGSLEFTALKDDLPGGRGTVLRAAWRNAAVSLVGEYGKDYPALGTPSYPMDRKAAETFWSLAIIKEFDFDRHW